MECHVSLKPFIDEIYKRPVIWNVNHLEYREKKKRRAAWEEISRIFHKDYDKKTNVEKSGISFTMSSKWRNIRDNYKRVHRAANTNKASKKTYIHGDLLQFLDPILSIRYKNQKKTKVTNENEDESDKSDEEEEDIEIKSEIRSDQELENYYIEEPEQSHLSQMPHDHADTDDDMAFYRSTLPMVRNMTQEQKIEFRIQVMNLIQNCLKNAT